MIINSIQINNVYQNNQNLHKHKNSYPKFCAKGIYPGSFYPITNGHLDIIKRSAKLFERNISNFVPECVNRTLYLKKSFGNIVKNLGFDKEKSIEVFNKIIDAYNNPTKGYHDDKHIASMLKNLDEFILNNPVSIQNQNEFKFAILMHDYVNGTPNEVFESISAAEKFIKYLAPNHNTNYIKKLILATDYSHKVTSPSIDEMLIQDLDLAILGSSPSDYKEYAKLIREQYFHISDDIFNKERTKVLQGFLYKESIYNLDYFKSKFEAPARINISNELESFK